MTDTNWRDMADRYGHTIEEVKEALPIEWVVAIEAGVGLVENGEGRSIGLCPFHVDENPSFDIYGNGERWGCFPCTKGGDVFDFIGDYWGLAEFGARFEKSLELLQKFESEADDWKSIISTAEPVKPVTVAELNEEVQGFLNLIEHETTKPLRDLLAAKKGLEVIDLDWLRREWLIGVTKMGEVVAPYWDREGHIVSYKTRRPDRGGWYTKGGTHLTALYGEWQLVGKDAAVDVWLCEGETDTWLASWLLRGRGIALGLPAGAGSRITDNWVELMRGRRFTTVMDADTAGRMAAQRWWTQTHTVAREVLITFPESDLRESRDPMRVLESGKIVPRVSGFVVTDPSGEFYRQLDRNGVPGEMVSNWVFHPTKHITYLDTHGAPAMNGFEGQFADETFHARRIIKADFRTAQALREWANDHDRAWYGASAKHAQGVFDQLKAQEPFLRQETAVPVAGLWGEDTTYPVFVLPTEAGGVIGSAQGAERWSYAAELSKVDVAGRFRLFDRSVDEAWARNSVGHLLGLNAQDVVTPLVAWMVASTLRKLVPEFPPMAVLGDSGSGKTAMTMVVMRYMWGFQGAENNLSNTTPYAVRAESAGINGLMIWWDEFRRGARRDTFAAMGQVIRDSWTASVSRRGGMGEDLSKVEQTAAIAPLLLSGEAAMEERSHIDRVVVIRLTKGGAGDLRNPAALDGLEAVVREGGGGVFGRRLIEWQLANLDVLRKLVPRERDRQAQGVAVLEWGWMMFREFVLEEWGIDLKWDLDVARVAAQREDVAENPEIEALLEALSLEAHERSDDPVPVAWVQTDPGDGVVSVVAFRARAFYQWATARGYVLPGGERATKQLLVDRFGKLMDDHVTWTGLGGLGGQYRVRGNRLLGVVEGESAVYRRAQIASLEASMGVDPLSEGGTRFVNGLGDGGGDL